MAEFLAEHGIEVLIGVTNLLVFSVTGALAWVTFRAVQTEEHRHEERMHILDIVEHKADNEHEETEAALLRSVV